ncbi:hypothetical protein M501DRAFT_994944 [Patellaria atrata CBS 101060]|uniref:Uncharacterized protein n=1 Tax=Patellaria atrata CBS 101060 TaxID=1346257 RepID=A0A9P4S9W5_9PEZI|nr:hypothetical protein M501DRAFT_994944 [Patellaria atrata CBS 101060]
MIWKRSNIKPMFVVEDCSGHESALGRRMKSSLFPAFCTLLPGTIFYLSLQSTSKLVLP